MSTSRATRSLNSLGAAVTPKPQRKRATTYRDGGKRVEFSEFTGLRENSSCNGRKKGRKKRRKREQLFGKESSNLSNVILEENGLQGETER